jgi:hypothetical protein
VAGTLLGLLLSLTFAGVRSNSIRLQDSIEHEAAQIVDLYHDLALFNTNEATQLQEQVASYTQLLIEKEWPLLAEDQISLEADKQFQTLYEGILSLDATTVRQEILRASLVEDVDEVSDFRQVRHFNATAPPLYFLYIALFGFVMTVVFMAVYPPDKVTLILIGSYCAFIGVVFYFLLALNDPFTGPIRVTPEAFEIISQDMFRLSGK